jgi:hypothetical protein
MSDFTIPTPEVIDAQTKFLRLKRQAQLLDKIHRLTPRVVQLGDVVGVLGTISLVTIASGGRWEWPTLLLGIGLLVFYQWRIGRLEARLDAMAGLLKATSGEDGQTA